MRQTQRAGDFLLDLGHPGLDVPEVLRLLGEICPSRPRIVAYGSHVDAAFTQTAHESIAVIPVADEDRDGFRSGSGAVASLLVRPLCADQLGGYIEFTDQAA